MRLQDRLRAPSGTVSIKELSTSGTPGFDGNKSDAKTDQAELADDLADFQERLHAHGTTDEPHRSILLVL